MKPSPEWNHYRVECVDGDLSLAVNGKVVTRGHRATPRKGYIGLESEGSPAEFKNLRIQELPVTVTLDPVDIAVPPEGFRPIYSGVDLTGWQSSGESGHWAVRDWTLACDGTGTAGVLSTVERFSDAEHLVDFRWSEKGKVGDWRKRMDFRGVNLATMLPAIPPAAEHPAGQWNRLRLKIRGNTVSATLNSTPIVTDLRVPTLAPTGPWVLHSIGDGLPLEMANFLVKSLD